jgi:two-component system, chemotaxis family, response regulator Rcp1
MSATFAIENNSPCPEAPSSERWKTAQGDSGRSPKPPESPAPSSAPAEDGANRRFRLLVAEDNPTDVLLLKEAIEAYHVPIALYIVDDGAKALDFILKSEHDPEAPAAEIVLLDLNLPRRSGLEVLRRVRQSEKFKNVRVIVFTSSDSLSDRANVAALGVTRYFRKPSDYEEFLQIGKILQEVCEELRSEP